MNEKYCVRYTKKNDEGKPELGLHGKFDTKEEAVAQKQKAEAYFQHAGEKATVTITYEDAAGNILPDPTEPPKADLKPEPKKAGKTTQPRDTPVDEA
jgi:hypothetical protein